MNTKEVQIGKSKITLYERPAKMVLDLSEMQDSVFEKHGNSMVFNAFVYSTVIAHSIKRALRDIPWAQFFIKLSYKKYSNYKRLIKELSFQELYNLYSEVLLLEGIDVKKKLNPEGSQLAE